MPRSADICTGRKYVRISYNDFCPIFSGTTYSRIFYDVFGNFAHGTKYSLFFLPFFCDMKITQKMVEKAHVFAQTMTNYFEPATAIKEKTLISRLFLYLQK